MFAYIWILILLVDGQVDLTEAILTVMFFVLFLLIAFADDKIRQTCMRSKKGILKNINEIR